MIYISILIPRLRRLYHSVLFFAGRHIYRDTYPNDEVRRRCQKCIDHLFWITFTNVSLMVVGGLCMFLIPLYMFLFRGKKLLLSPIDLPFVDDNTPFGHHANQINRAMYATAIGASVITIEIITCVLKNNIWAASELIRYSFDAFDQKTGNYEGLHDSLETELILRNILLQIQDMDKVILSCKDVYYWKFLLQPYFLVYTVSSCLLTFMLVSKSKRIR